MVKIMIILLIIILFKYFFKYLISKNFLKNNKKKLIKKVLLSKIFNLTNRNINNINILFIKERGRFGNYFNAINNAIIYCEFLGCKKIFIEYNNKIYIKKKIFLKKENITIEPNKAPKSIDNNSIALGSSFFFHNGFRWFKNINKLIIYKKHLLNNLPKVVTNQNDLYIYIRSGDIFLIHKSSIRGYYQPPFCFYDKIMKKFKFSKVFIISEDKLNPVIHKLLNKYPFIKTKKNNLKLDISYLINSYNIVVGKSTFLSTTIKLNDKLKFLWEYDLYSSFSRTYLDFHYSFYKFPVYYTIYKMNSTANYRKLIYPWINSPKQRKIMIEEKCIFNFDIIRN